MANQTDTLGTLFKTVGVKNVKRAKAITVGAGVVVAGLIVFAIVRNRKERLERKDARKYDAKDMGDELGNIGVSNRNVTISQGDAIIITQNLVAAMDKWGTDEDAIYRALESLQTRDDLLLIIQTFGVKPYSGTGVAANWLTRTGYKNLNGWLKAELNSKEQQRVKAEFERLNVPF